MRIRMLLCLLCTTPAFAQLSVPLRQGAPPAQGQELPPLTLREATREDRWLGLGVRDVRWSPDGIEVYFRWKQHPQSSDNPDLDPWYAVTSDGSSVIQLDEGETGWIPGPELHWSRDGQRAAWLSQGRVFLYDTRPSAASRTRLLYAADQARRLHISPDGHQVRFEVDEELLEFEIDKGSLRRLSSKHVKGKEPATDAARWLKEQQLDLFERHRSDKERSQQSERYERRIDPAAAQTIPVDSDRIRLQDIQLSPDRRFVTYRWSEAPAHRPRTQYIDFADASGYATVEDARPKVGEPQGRSGMSIVRYDLSVDGEEVESIAVSADYADERTVAIHGPYWSLEGDQALVQVLSTDHKDRWISRLQFQDAARLVQRLIELEKDFEVMYYPLERHVIRSEASRYDYRRRVVRFFERHLLRHP